MKITEEIIDQCYVHAKSTGKTPDTLRISNDLWQQLKQECEDTEEQRERSLRP